MAGCRGILAVIRALPAEVEGIPVRQPLPRGGMSYLPPILLLHHMGRMGVLVEAF